MLAVVAALLHQLEGSFAKSNVQKISALTIQAVAVLLIIQSAAKVLTEAASAVTRLTDIMELLLPVQFLLMVGLGNLKRSRRRLHQSITQGFSQFQPIQL